MGQIKVTGKTASYSYRAVPATITLLGGDIVEAAQKCNDLKQEAVDVIKEQIEPTVEYTLQQCLEKLLPHLEQEYIDTISSFLMTLF